MGMFMGVNLVVVLLVGERLLRGMMVVMVMCDMGMKYLSKIGWSCVVVFILDKLCSCW